MRVWQIFITDCVVDFQVNMMYIYMICKARILQLCKYLFFICVHKTALGSGFRPGHNEARSGTVTLVENNVLAEHVVEVGALGVCDSDIDA